MMLRTLAAEQAVISACTSAVRRAVDHPELTKPRVVVMVLIILRTRLRPLPEGRLHPRDALGFGVTVTAGGLLYLSLLVNPLSGFITAVSMISYLFLYTPLKLKTPLCIFVGAIPGALPPVTGWAAAARWPLASLLDQCAGHLHALLESVLHRQQVPPVDADLLTDVRAARWGADRTPPAGGDVLLAQGVH